MPARLTRRATLAGMLAAPHLARAESAQVLRFVPHAGLGWLDPTYWPFLETRNHAMAVYDTLYGLDAQGRVQPQMAEGHVVEDDGRIWRIRLRAGLVFHDGTKVLARDCVASILRWGAHSIMGASLLAASADIAAPDDRSIVFRLRRRFPLLAAALGDRAMQVCAMMPARIAEAASFRAIDEVVGSGPYRFLADEYQPWQRAAYARHDAYRPRPEGLASFTAGPKLAHFARIEWQAMPADAALAALKTGQVDWWESPPAPAHTAIAADPGLVLAVRDRAGFNATMRLNHVIAPFNCPALRRAVLAAVDQAAFVAAASGGACPAAAPAGFFTPGAPMAGPGRATSALSPAAGRAAVAAAGGAGVAITVLGIDDQPRARALAVLGAGLLGDLGFAVTLQLVPLAGLVPLLLRTQPAGTGGWNVVFGYWSGHDHWHPGIHRYLRANGMAGEVGWPSSDRLEALRRTWLAAGDAPARAGIAAEITAQAASDVPYVPLGHWREPTAHAANLAGMLDGFTLFWNLRRG